MGISLAAASWVDQADTLEVFRRMPACKATAMIGTNGKI
jgi:hypothetical protein